MVVCCPLATVLLCWHLFFVSAVQDPYHALQDCRNVLRISVKVSLLQSAMKLHLVFHAAPGFVRFGGFSYRPLHLKFNESTPRIHTVTLHLLLTVATRVLQGHKADGDKQYLVVSSVSLTVSHLCFNVTLTGAGMFLGLWWSAGLRTCPLYTPCDAK